MKERAIAEMYARRISTKHISCEKSNQVLTAEPEPEVGPTPKEVIWTKNKTKLYRYISETTEKT